MISVPEDLSHIEQHLSSLDQRVQGIERWKAEQNTNTAVRQERDKHLDRRFDQLESAVDEVKGYLLRIVWIIVAGILGTLLTFMLGGFPIVP